MFSNNNLEQFIRQMNGLQESIRILSEKIDHLEEQQQMLLRNQQVLYNRNLVTRKNLCEIASGKMPSMTKNEKLELEKQRHPELVQGSIEFSRETVYN